MKKMQTLLILCGSLVLLSSCAESGRSEAEAAEQAAILARLDALEAESEIRHKLQTYMPVLAASDWDTYINYFTRDAKLIMTEGTRTGRDDIKERMATAGARLAANAADRPVRKRADLLANVEVQVTGNTATAQSRFVFIGENAEGGFDVSGSGRYLDEWALEEGEWRISARTIDYDLLRVPPAPAAPAAQQ